MFVVRSSLALPLLLLALTSSLSSALPNHFGRTGLFPFLSVPWPSSAPPEKRSGLDLGNNGTSFLWVIQDTYQGKTFFDGFTFWNYSDPTHGMVNYVNQDVAFSEGLAYVNGNNQVIMKGDNTTHLNNGQYRDSVRITSKTLYTTGLFILDLNKAPWGCAVWPAFWTVGESWPQDGEIDIIEGVHDNEHNQVTWHTAPGCSLDPHVNFTGIPVSQNQSSCDATLSDNAGCGVVEWSRASYGPYFDAQQGGVFAMKWDEEGIAVWSFYRAAIPHDILSGAPNPSNWGVPVAALDPSACDLRKYFVNHSIIFDITFCGDWAGNSYATSGCPGTCNERLMDPANFINATWIINSLKVYQKRGLTGSVYSGAEHQHAPSLIALLGGVAIGATLMWTGFGL